jgi:hypothetical protein
MQAERMAAFHEVRSKAVLPQTADAVEKVGLEDVVKS